MTLNRTNEFAVAVDDITYLEYDGVPLLARTFLPEGGGPFPAMVHLHGGAWTLNDRTLDDKMLAVLAGFGVSIISVDFRMPPVAGYPASLTDTNYAIRWAKANAAQWKSTPGHVGVMGGSSGGHMAVLAGMRPDDARYAATPLPAGSPAVDASVAAVVALWPVIDPLARYQYASDLNTAAMDESELTARGLTPQYSDVITKAHGLYWGDTAAMGEGSPVEILKAHEEVAMPPIFYVGSEADNAHPYPHLVEFVDLYRGAGGRVDLELTETNAGPILGGNPEGEQALAIFGKLVAFLNQATA